MKAALFFRVLSLSKFEIFVFPLFSIRFASRFESSLRSEDLSSPPACAGVSHGTENRPGRSTHTSSPDRSCRCGLNQLRDGIPASAMISLSVVEIFLNWGFITMPRNPLSWKRVLEPPPRIERYVAFLLPPRGVFSSCSMVLVPQRDRPDPDSEVSERREGCLAGELPGCLGEI